MANNYTLGRGELYFAPLVTVNGVSRLRGERYIGNTPEFNATIEPENLDHYNSDRGIREKDASIVLQVNRTATFITDNISPQNIANFFFGSDFTFTTVGATVTGEAITDVELGLTYQLGMTGTNPVGARALDVHTAGPPAVNILVKKGATTFVEGTDYLIDMALARLTILEDGTIVDGDDLTVDYKTKSSSRSRIISGSKPVEGALRYISYNPAGTQFQWYMPNVKLSPNGDYALKGDEWQQIPFNVEIIKPSDKEAIYIDGEPLTV